MTLRPENLQVRARLDTADRRVALTIGLLNPKNEIGLRLLVLEPVAQHGPRLWARTRVPDLREPVVTTQNLRKRFEPSFFTPIWLVLWLLLLAVLLRERWEQRAGRRATAIAGRVLGTVLLSGYAGAGLAYGVAWLLARLAYVVTSR